VTKPDYPHRGILLAPATGLLLADLIIASVENNAKPTNSFTLGGVTRQGGGGGTSPSLKEDEGGVFEQKYEDSESLRILEAFAPTRNERALFQLFPAKTAVNARLSNNE
jgi:hypothetical protein